MNEGILRHELRRRPSGWWRYQFQFAFSGLFMSRIDHHNEAINEQVSTLYVEINNVRRDIDLTDINPAMVGLE